MNKPRKTKTGFTLVEMTVSLAIVTILIGMIYMIYGSGKDLFETKAYQTDMQAQGRQAMDTMTRELRLATRTSTQNPSPNINIPSTPNNKQIHFYLPEMVNGSVILDAQNDIDWDTNSMIRYQYIPGQNELRRSTSGGSPTTLASNVTSVQFFDTTIDPTLGLNEIKIVLGLSRTTPRQRTITMNLSSIVRVRN